MLHIKDHHPTDAAIRVVISIGVPIAKFRDFWSLNSFVSGYAIAEPRLAHFGLRFFVVYDRGFISLQEYSWHVIGSL